MRWKVLTLAVVLVGCGVGTAGTALAGDPTVNRVLAVEYNSGVFTAAVLAHGPDPLVAASVRVNGLPVVPDKTNHIVLNAAKNVTLFTLTKYGSTPVVQPGYVVEADVTDLQGDMAEKSVTCLAGQRLPQLVVCR
jgi:hypothetical protein